MKPRPRCSRGWTTILTHSAIRSRRMPPAAFDKAGLAAFEKHIRARFEAASAEPSGWPYRRGSEILRAIYYAQRDIRPTSRWPSKTGLKPEDCLAVAKLHHRSAKAGRGADVGGARARPRPGEAVSVRGGV